MYKYILTRALMFIMFNFFLLFYFYWGNRQRLKGNGEKIGYYLF